MAEKSLRDRFEDFDRRMAELEARPVTPEEHDVAELLNDLRGKRERMQAYLHARGTAATWATQKDAPEGARQAAERGDPPRAARPAAAKSSHGEAEHEYQRDYPLHSTIADDAEAEREMEAMERAFNRGQTLFR